MPEIPVTVSSVTDAQGDSVMVLTDVGLFDDPVLKVELGPTYSNGDLPFPAAYTIVFDAGTGNRTGVFNLADCDDEYASFLRE